MRRASASPAAMIGQETNSTKKSTDGFAGLCLSEFTVFGFKEAFNGISDQEEKTKFARSALKVNLYAH